MTNGKTLQKLHNHAVADIRERMRGISDDANAELDRVQGLIDAAQTSVDAARTSLLAMFPEERPTTKIAKHAAKPKAAPIKARPGRKKGNDGLTAALQEVLLFVDDRDTVTQVADVAKHFDLAQGTAGNRLSQLYKRGRIKRTAMGMYAGKGVAA